MMKTMKMTCACTATGNTRRRETHMLQGTCHIANTRGMMLSSFRGLFAAVSNHDRMEDKLRWRRGGDLCPLISFRRKCAGSILLGVVGGCCRYDAGTVVMPLAAACGIPLLTTAAVHPHQERMRPLNAFCNSIGFRVAAAVHTSWQELMCPLISSRNAVRVSERKYFARGYRLLG